MIDLGNDWNILLKDVFESENYRKIREFLKTEYKTHTIYPSMFDIFNCFRLTPPEKVKAVILGQDPYHNPNQAHGLCFSVKDGIEPPPSLKNIFKELKSDLIIEPPISGNLTKWAENGVLLLNTVLTVRENQPNSHRTCGWEKFTDEVIELISKNTDKTVFILWGGNARSKKRLIDQSKHCVIESAHPSPLSCYNGFFGSKPFSRTNDYLKKNGKNPIDWNF